MGRIILARHGQDQDNAKAILNGRRDNPLTEKGVTQAYDLVNNIKKSGFKIGLIISSNLQRARRTAEICSFGLGIEHIVLESLIERSHGILEGHHISDIPILAREYKNAYGHTYVIDVEGGESYPDLCIRAERVLFEIKGIIISRGIKDDVLVVSHGAISKAMEVVHLGLTWRNVFDTPSFSNCEFRVLK